jgi:hypothetical protein
MHMTNMLHVVADGVGCSYQRRGYVACTSTCTAFVSDVSVGSFAGFAKLGAMSALVTTHLL